MSPPTTPDSGEVVGAVLFTDLVGFTEFNDTEGDAAALRVLDHQTELMTQIVGRHDARIVKELGDGLMVWFASPVAAVEGGAAMLMGIEHLRSTDAFPVAIRMGLHHGEMLARGDDFVGITVNIAARVADLAGPSELLVSEATVDACPVRPATPLESVGPALVKGVADPIWLVRASTNDREPTPRA
jgi:class 3 adenylate cyclase